MIGFLVVKIDNGLFLKVSGYNYKTYRVNGGVEYVDCNLDGWRFYEGVKELLTVEEEENDTQVPDGWVLKSPEVESKDIPAKFTLEELKYDCEDGFYGDNSAIGVLYKKSYTTIKGGWIDLPFSIKDQKSYDVSLGAPVDFDIYQSGTADYGRKPINGVKPSTSTVDQLIFPDIIQQFRPCFLSSKETYAIVRYYIKNNIDPKEAEITSDHDFCFTVKKKVSKKPHTWTSETKKANGRSYARPRVKTHTTSHTSVQIFEMTHDGRNYDGYSVIKGFKGVDQEDLKQTIDAYLEELINYINLPLHECETCAGTGTMAMAKFKKNEREDQC